MEAQVELARVNRLRSCSIRPIVLRDYGAMGVMPNGNPTGVFPACREWGRYLVEEAMTQGVDVCVSSWNRMAPNTLPALAKAGGNCLNSQLIRMRADLDGYVSEGSGESIVTRNGRIHTPPPAASVLSGITRASVLALAREAGIAVVGMNIPREMLYIDEIFSTGTAAEVTPVRSVDRIPVGSVTRGLITERLQKAFFGIVEGRVEDRYGRLTPVQAE
ncbi:MAG: aminotransferase class IV [Bryobacteraceae bacterium]